jgi:hypothetical protein
MGLCVNRRGAATYGGSGLLYRVGAYENAGVVGPDFMQRFKLWRSGSILAEFEETGTF